MTRLPEWPQREQEHAWGSGLGRVCQLHFPVLFGRQISFDGGSLEGNCEGCRSILLFPEAGFDATAGLCSDTGGASPNECDRFDISIDGDDLRGMVEHKFARTPTEQQRVKGSEQSWRREWRYSVMVRPNKSVGSFAKLSATD